MTVIKHRSPSWEPITSTTLLQRLQHLSYQQRQHKCQYQLGIIVNINGNITLELSTLQGEVVWVMDEKRFSEQELLKDAALAWAHRICQCCQCDSTVHLHPAPPQTWQSTTMHLVTKVLTNTPDHWSPHKHTSSLKSSQSFKVLTFSQSCKFSCSDLCAYYYYYYFFFPLYFVWHSL